MNAGWQRFAAIVLLALLGGGILFVLGIAVSADGKIDMADGGWGTAAFLSLREIMSKIEKIALSIKEAAAKTEAWGRKIEPPLDLTGSELKD